MLNKGRNCFQMCKRGPQIVVSKNNNNDNKTTTTKEEEEYRAYSAVRETNLYMFYKTFLRVEFLKSVFFCVCVVKWFYLGHAQRRCEFPEALPTAVKALSESIKNEIVNLGAR